MERQTERQNTGYHFATLYTSNLNMHSLPTEPSKANFATNKSDSVCSIPDLTTTESSIGHIGSPTRSKGTDETQSSQAQRHLSTTKFAGLPVFQLLQNQNVNREEDIDLDQITTWVREMVLDPDDDRQKRFEKVFLRVDGMMTAGGASGQREHPTSDQGFTEHPKSHYVTTIVSGDPPKRRRKRTCGEESSQASRQESESKNNSTGHRAESRTHPKGKRYLSCPFVKRDPVRYDEVANPCTERFGFPNPGRVAEHVKKYHSLAVPCCYTCKQRFSGNKIDAERTQQVHTSVGVCQPRELGLDEPEWMDEQQNFRFASLNMTGQKTSAEEKWRSIYRQIFGIAESAPVPDPCAADTSHVGEYSDSHPPSLGPPDFRNDQIGNAPPFTLSPPTAFLTAQSLDINEQHQPETDHYIVYQGYDSGYQSLGQESGLDTIVPAPDISEFVDLSDPPSEGQLDIELGHASHKDASLDLLDLEMNSSQFPESAVAGKKKRKGLENEL